MCVNTFLESKLSQWVYSVQSNSYPFMPSIYSAGQGWNIKKTV